MLIFMQNLSKGRAFAKPMYEYNRKTAELLLEAAGLLREEIPLHLLVGPGDQLDI